MKKKVVKYISSIFYCIGIGGIILYLYNLFVNMRKYGSVPAEIDNNMQLYLLIGIGAISLGIIIILIFKIFENKNKVEDSNEVVENELEFENFDNVDAESNECEEETTDEEYINKYYSDDIISEDKDKQSLVIRVLPKILLIIFILVCIYFVYILTLDSRIINKRSDKKVEFLNIAINITSEIKYDEIKLSGNKVYLTLSDLNYESDKFNTSDSYIIIDKQLKRCYLVLSGINAYSDYGIDYVDINELNISKISDNQTISRDINDKLIIDAGDRVIIYNKN